MLAKCANPACSATFRYLHQGRLFAIEISNSARQGPPIGLEYTGNSNSPQYYWLCASCCRAMTVQSDGEHGISLVRLEKTPRSVSVEEDSVPMAA